MIYIILYVEEMKEEFEISLLMSPFFNSCVAVTRSDHSVAQLRVAVPQ